MEQQLCALSISPSYQPIILEYSAFTMAGAKKLEIATDLGFLHDRISLALAWYRIGYQTS